jgi:hypothetical protein
MNEYKPLASRPVESGKMTKRVLGIALAFAGWSAGDAMAGGRPRTVLWNEAAIEVGTASEASSELWVTTADLTRVTGFVLKPQGVCRDEVCIPLPKAREREFLKQRSKVTWFNLSAFARLLKQPSTYDETLSVWYFGERPEQQGARPVSLQAPDFTLPDREGKTHTLSDFRGKKVLLVTWASW